jgi:intein/homing endonuclease
MKSLPSIKRAYLAGFLDGDGSIYVQLKPNTTYRYGYQVAAYIVLFQSAKDKEKFRELTDLIGLGHTRERNDGILEHIISRIDEIREMLKIVKPYVILKRKQVMLMEQILDQKEKVENRDDFKVLAGLVDLFRELNYSKKRKRRTLTP